MPPVERVPLPWSRSCFVCGQDNPAGLRARSFLVGDEIELRFRPAPEHVGWMAVTHGGLIATVLDEVMTWAAMVDADQACFAAEFSVRLRQPLPPETEVFCRARCTGRRRTIHFTEARVESADGEVFATATGRYASIPRSQVSEMHHDMVSTPECWPAEHIFAPASEDRSRASR